MDGSFGGQLDIRFLTNGNTIIEMLHAISFSDGETPETILLGCFPLGPGTRQFEHELKESPPIYLCKPPPKWIQLCMTNLLDHQFSCLLYGMGTDNILMETCPPE